VSAAVGGASTVAYWESATVADGPSVPAPARREPPAGSVDGEPGGAEVDDGLPELVFVRAMAGFAELTRFALVRLTDDPDPADEADPSDCVIFELRSLQDPDVRFVVAAPTAYFPDYAFELDEGAVAELGLESSDDALVLVVLTVGADAASTTANLLAPVVVNARTRSAAQVILSGTQWPVRAAVV